MNRNLVPVALILALTSTLALAEIPELALQATGTPSKSSPTARPAALEPAPQDARRLSFPADARERIRDLDAWFAATATHRLHAQLDRPLYRPGDTVQLKVWELATRGLAPSAAGVTAQLVDPRGTVQQTRWLATAEGAAADAFVLDAGAAGGSWKVQLVAPNGTLVEREFVVATFEAPRVKKTLEFGRDGYGPGDAVEAVVTLERSTGEPLANVVATARVQADGVPLDPLEVRTDARGEATVSFTLPATLQQPDVLLTVLVDDGGVTESISRPVPVVLDRVRVQFFPEGGDLVAGLPARVYFEATDPHGEPTEVEGVVVDDRGRTVASLETWVDGRGHASFTPQPGRRYVARLDRPAELEQSEFPLPEPTDRGCALRHHDDLDGKQRAVRVSVTCTDSREVIVIASQQEQVLDKAAVRVAANRPTTVHLRSADPALAGAQGVARVTVLDGSDLAPVAERLVYRNRGRQLSVRITADKDQYAPGDPVALTVRTTDPEGRLVPAELALSVVDDTLLSFADDDAHDIRSQVLLQADLPEPIEGAAEWFDPQGEEGGLALDLALGTRGWRRFDWTPVIGFTDQQRRLAKLRAEEEAYLEGLGYWGVADMAGGMPMDYPAAAEPMPEPTAVISDERRSAPRAKSAPVPPPPRPQSAAAPVRQFAQPVSGADKTRDQEGQRQDSGPEVRTDFRDTVLWQPQVRTGADGVARVKFALSDAVTGFRVTAEGVGGGWVGRGDALLSSRLPFHLEAKLPVELSAGDQLLLPVTLENQQDTAVEVDLAVQASALLALGALPGDVGLRPGERRTVHVPLTANPGRGLADLSLTADAGRLSDAVVRSIPVAPRGFPRTAAWSGVLEGRVGHEVTVPNAVPGSITGKVTVFPSPVSELLEGMEGMVRTPGGCFEQTSSTNYPNVLVLDLLERTGSGGKLAVDRQQVLQTGYGILTGYQVETGGFETWGSGPGKEALSAYGLLQFSDMSRVFDVERRIIDDNVRYLYQQRDGRGGFAITGASAHGYGTAPPEVLDAYITWALVETGHTDLPEEIAAQAALARRTNDPYRLALATLTLLATTPAEGKAAAARLAKLQDPDGSFPGSETSITRSENYNLLVEATALSAIALLRAGDYGNAEEAIRWIHSNQTGAGVWGATQGNALALKAIAEAATALARAEGGGRIGVLVDGKRVGELRYEAGQREPLELDLGRWLSSGTHAVALTMDGGPMPYSLEVGWASENPPSDPERRVELTAALADDEVRLGETTRLTARLSNRTRDVVPDPIARIGLPAGLTAQTWQLEQLKDRGEIAFFETRPREVTLYWDGLAAGEVHEVALDLVAEVPGTFTGPASAAYPYYDDQARSWVAGLLVEIDP